MPNRLDAPLRWASHLLTNVRLGLKWFIHGYNTLAYFGKFYNIGFPCNMIGKFSVEYKGATSFGQLDTLSTAQKDQLTRRRDTQRNGTQYKGLICNALLLMQRVVMLSVTFNLLLC